MNKNIYILVAGTVGELIALVIGLVYAGRWIDEKMGWSGLAMTIGGFLAMFIWGAHLMILFKKFGDEGNSKNTKN